MSNLPTANDLLKTLETTLAQLAALDLESTESASLVPLVKGVQNIAAYAAALDAQIQTRAVANGELIPGVKTERSRSNRAYADADAAKELAIGEFGAECLTEPALLSPAQMEKKFGKRCEAFIALCTVKPEGTLRASY